jgi:hypothetical protein
MSVLKGIYIFLINPFLYEIETKFLKKQLNFFSLIFGERIKKIKGGGGKKKKKNQIIGK